MIFFEDTLEFTKKRLKCIGLEDGVIVLFGLLASLMFQNSSINANFFGGLGLKMVLKSFFALIDITKSYRTFIINYDFKQC